MVVPTLNCLILNFMLGHVHINIGRKSAKPVRTGQVWTLWQWIEQSAQLIIRTRSFQTEQSSDALIHYTTERLQCWHHRHKDQKRWNERKCTSTRPSTNVRMTLHCSTGSNDMSDLATLFSVLSESGHQVYGLILIWPTFRAHALYY